MNKRFRISGVAALLLAAALTPALAQEKPLKIGVTAGPHAQILEVVRKVAEKDGLALQVVEFSDFIQPDAALADGSLDANVYQHQPFLEAQNRDRGYKLVALAPAVRQQLGVYSRKVKSLADLKEGARIGIPNDPTNASRALFVLREHGLIQLKEGVGARASVLDIIGNTKKLKFIELEAAQLPRSLEDLDAAAVNSSYAVPAGLSPQKDALVLESPVGPYVTVVIAARDGSQGNARLQRFVKAYQSAEVKTFIDTQFKGAYTAAW